MTQQEFETRVKVKVSPNEFEHINEVYMNSDLNKDEFCKLWVKMNQTRVNKAKDEALIEKTNQKIRDGLYDILNRSWEEKWLEKADDVFNDSQKRLLEKVGIPIVVMTDSSFYYMTVSGILFQIRKYLKIV